MNAHVDPDSGKHDRHEAAMLRVDLAEMLSLIPADMPNKRDMLMNELAATGRWSLPDIASLLNDVMRHRDVKAWNDRVERVCTSKTEWRATMTEAV